MIPSRCEHRGRNLHQGVQQHCKQKSLMQSVDGQCFLELCVTFKTGASKKKGKARIQLTKATALGKETTGNLQEERQRTVGKYWFVSVKWKVHGPGWSHLLSWGSFNLISSLFVVEVSVLMQWMKIQSHWFQFLTVLAKHSFFYFDFMSPGQENLVAFQIWGKTK